MVVGPTRKKADHFLVEAINDGRCGWTLVERVGGVEGGGVVGRSLSLDGGGAEIFVIQVVTHDV